MSGYVNHLSQIVNNVVEIYGNATAYQAAKVSTHICIAIFHVSTAKYLMYAMHGLWCSGVVHVCGALLISSY